MPACFKLASRNALLDASLKHAGMTWFFLLMLGLIVISAWILHSTFLLNWDVSWCMHAAEHLMKGGTYIKDFFDVNFPLALYLYIPPNLMKKYLDLNIMESSRLYIFFLNFISVSFSFYFLRKIFHNNLHSAYIFTMVLAFLLFIFPVIHLGQREHLFLIFTLPYFFAVGLISLYPSYKNDQTKIVIPAKAGIYFEWNALIKGMSENTKLQVDDYKWIPAFAGMTKESVIAIILGIFAFLGFTIKPYFFLSFIFLELYILFTTRNILSWMRVEVLTIIFLSIGYAIFIGVFYPDFITTVIPLTLKYFYTNYSSESLLLLLTQSSFLYALFAIIIFMMNKKQGDYQALSHVLFIGMLGAIFSYLLQKVSWAYHLLPLLTFSVLLLMCIIVEWMKDIKINSSSFLFGSIFALWVFSYPTYFLFHQYQLAVTFKQRLQPLINYMDTHTSHQSVYFLSVTIEDALPAIDYSQSILSGHFAHLPLLPGILEKMSLHSPKVQWADGIMTKMIVDDLNDKKPEFVFVDARKYKSYYRDFDYLTHFSKHPSFVDAWKNYHYFQTIDQPMVLSTNIDVLFYHLPEFDKEKIDKLINDNNNKKIIFLIGKGEQRMAYIYKKFKGDKALSLRSENITLSAKEQQFIDSEKNTLLDSKCETLTLLIQKIIFAAYPFYKLDVYKRG